MLNGIMSVLVIFMIMAVGAYFTWRKKWPESTNKVFSIAVVQIAAPALAIVSIENHFTPQLLQASLMNLLVIAVMFVIMVVVVTFVDMGERRIPLQIAKQVKGRRVYLYIE